jgi:hypothetical protein
MRRQIPIFVALPVLAAALLCAVAAQAGELRKTEEKTFQVPAGGKVSVIADEGDITIESWDNSEVFVTVTKKAWSRRKNRAEKIMEKIRVEMTLEGNTLTVREPEDQRWKGSELSELFRGDWFSDGEGYSVDYSLKVPKEIGIRAEADEGDVACSGISGSLSLLRTRVKSARNRSASRKADSRRMRAKSGFGASGAPAASRSKRMKERSFLRTSNARA